jgi:predicted enzyme related to lactoylglutathione lyase
MAAEWGADAFYKRGSEMTAAADSTVIFEGASPIGDTDTGALPVKDLGPAIGYYMQVLGFSLEEKDDNRAMLRRDEARIGLAKNGADPEQASVYFPVSNVEALRAELEAKGIEPSPLRVDEYGGARYRVFFAKEPYGVCFCFGQKQTE